MSGLNLTHTHWLSSLDPDLLSDIYASIDTLTHAAKSFREAKVSASPESLTTLSLLLARQIPMEGFLDVLRGCPVACNWNSFMKAGRPPLRSNIFVVQSWLSSVPSSMDSMEAQICLAIMTSISSTNPDILGMWRKLFNIFNPSSPPKPSEQSIRKQTPITHNSGGRHDTETTHERVDPVLRRELHLLLYPDTPGFIRTYFRCQRPAFQNSASLRTGAGWVKWPVIPDGKHVWPWFKSVTDRILPPAVTVAYYSSADTVLSGSLAARKTDIVLYPTSATKMNPKGIRSNNGQYAWKDVLVVGELKPTSKKPGDLIIHLAGYVREIFYVQSNRRFVHAFTIAGDLLQTWIFHHGGGFGSKTHSINLRPEVFVDVFVGYALMTPEELGFDTTLKFDSYKFRMECESKDHGEDCVFRIESKVFFHRKAIASRGTTCWSVVERKNDNKYILKDSWRSVNYPSEITLLRKAMERNVQGIVEVIAFEEVMFNGKLDDIRENIMRGLQVGKPMRLKLLPASTDAVESPADSVSEAALPTPSYSPYPPEGVTPVGSTSLSWTRSGGAPQASSGSLNCPSPGSSTGLNTGIESIRVSSRKRGSSSIHAPRPKEFRDSPRPTPPPEFNRVHTRILMRQGRHLTTFTNNSELLWGFHDAIEGHRSLVENDILHRDISMNNIMLSDPGDRTDGKRGFIIDLDLAVEVSSAQPSSAPHRAGIIEFNAIGVLRGERHTFRHDLESFFYVFLWMCVIDPRLEWRWTPLSKWATGGMLEVAEAKEKHMRRGAYAGYESIEKWFRDWAKELKEVAEQWREALFRMKPTGLLTLETPENRSGMYDEILGALKAAAVKMDGN